MLYATVAQAGPSATGAAAAAGCSDPAWVEPGGRPPAYSGRYLTTIDESGRSQTGSASSMV